jgi:hypothetical protein
MTLPATCARKQLLRALAGTSTSFALLAVNVPNFGAGEARAHENVEEKR